SCVIGGQGERARRGKMVVAWHPCPGSVQVFADLIVRPTLDNTPSASAHYLPASPARTRMASSGPRAGGADAGLASAFRVLASIAILRFRPSPIASSTATAPIPYRR